MMLMTPPSPPCPYRIELEPEVSLICAMFSVGMLVGSNCMSKAEFIGMPSKRSSTCLVRKPRMSMRGTPSAPVRTFTPGRSPIAWSSVFAPLLRISSALTVYTVSLACTPSAVPVEETTTSPSVYMPERSSCAAEASCASGERAQNAAIKPNAALLFMTLLPLRNSILSPSTPGDGADARSYRGIAFFGLLCPPLSPAALTAVTVNQ